MKAKVYTIDNWRMYPDKDTIRIEQNIDKKWTVKYIIINLNASKKSYRLGNHKYQVRYYTKPGHHTEGPCCYRLCEITHYIKVWDNLNIPDEIIDIIDSWSLMDEMKKVKV